MEFASVRAVVEEHCLVEVGGKMFFCFYLEKIENLLGELIFVIAGGLTFA